MRQLKVRAKGNMFIKIVEALVISNTKEFVYLRCMSSFWVQGLACIRLLLNYS